MLYVRFKKLLARLKSIRVLRENSFFKNADFLNEDGDTKSVSSCETGFTWSTVSTFTVSSDVDFNNTGSTKPPKANRTKRLNFVYFRFIYFVGYPFFVI